MEEFMQKFKFGRTDFNIAVEREWFLLKKGKLAPLAELFLSFLPKDGRYGNELSACQVEERFRGMDLNEVKENMLLNKKDLSKVDAITGLTRKAVEKNIDKVPLNVFPTERYLKLSKNMDEEELRAACALTATHVHIKMETAEQALKVYNGVIHHTDELLKMGDKLIETYSIVEPKWYPLAYETWIGFMCKALKYNFYNNPRNCWHIIRISVHGTIEFRTFGATESEEKVLEWTKVCQELCSKYT